VTPPPSGPSVEPQLDARYDHLPNNFDHFANKLDKGVQCPSGDLIDEYSPIRVGLCSFVRK